jgi:hypothetical protein
MPARPQPIYFLMLRPARGRDGIRELRALLKTAWRRHGLRCVALRETHFTTNRIRASKVPLTARDLQSGCSEPETVTERNLVMVTKSEAFPSKWVSAADLPKPIAPEIVETNTEVLKTGDGVSSKNSRRLLPRHEQSAGVQFDELRFDRRYHRRVRF